MVNGLYFAASSMVSQDSSIEAIAGNLANLSTPGYKRDVPAFSSYLLAVLDTPLDQPLPDPNATSIVQSSALIDLSDGMLRKTENPFDTALQDPDSLSCKLQMVKHTPAMAPFLSTAATPL